MYDLWNCCEYLVCCSIVSYCQVLNENSDDNPGDTPTLKQIKQRMKDLPLKDYMDALQLLQSLRHQRSLDAWIGRMVENEQIRMSTVVEYDFDQYKKEKEWPIRG